MAVADEVGVSIPTVLLWRRRFKSGLADAPHPGRPRTYGREVRERVLAETLQAPEDDATTHSSRERLDPGPELVAKVTDVVGLYLNPPKWAIVLFVDEKTQI